MPRSDYIPALWGDGGPAAGTSARTPPLPAGGEAPCLRHGQVLVAHVEHAGDSLTVAALETHGVTTKDPAARARKASKKH